MYKLLLLLYIASTSSYNGVPIGGLFTTTETAEELAFRYAAESINVDHKILRNYTLMTHSEKVTQHDSFQVTEAVCDLLGIGIAGIFGHHSRDTSEHVQSMCDAVDVPHIETRWDVRQKRQDFLVNLHPHPATWSRMYSEIVKAWKWKGFTVIYEDGEGLLRLRDLLSFYPPKGPTVTVRQLHPSLTNHRTILTEIRQSGERNVVLDCSVDRLEGILRQAQQVGLIVAGVKIFITNPDMHTVDLSAFQWAGTNITGIRLVDPHNVAVQEAVTSWSDREVRRGGFLNITPDTLRLNTALIYDAVFLFAKALARLQDPQVFPIDCASDATWKHGASMINFMRDGESFHRGLSGLVQFDAEGFRSKFEVDVLELGDEGLQKIATWNSTSGLNLTRVVAESAHSRQLSLRNMSFVVITALSKPYGMMKESSYALTGNDQYEGFGIQLIDELSIMLGFNYTFRLQEDQVYGSLNKVTQEWDGMILEILEHRADLAITDLTITAERESAVDFTMPFMNLGISILYKAATRETPRLFSFLSTFSDEVWIYMLAAFIGVSLLVVMAARISSKEWNNPYPCIQEPEVLKNQFNVNNAFWMTTGSLMQQGSETAPIAASTRMIGGMWGFFTLIMVSTYKANLTAVLTASSLSQPFKTVNELANQNEISYGAKTGGSTAGFFESSNNPVYQRMWTYMSTHPETWTVDNPQGQAWVKQKKYAYLMESTTIEYIVERDCEVQQIGGLLDHKGYGIAMRKDSWYRNELSTAVLRLQETGKLTKMKERWWKEERGGGACSSAGGGKASQLSLAHLGGVFVVLLAGLGVAVVITVVEIIYDAWLKSYRGKVSFRAMLTENMWAIVYGRGERKSARKCKINSDIEDEEVQERQRD